MRKGDAASLPPVVESVQNPLNLMKGEKTWSPAGSRVVLQSNWQSLDRLRASDVGAEATAYEQPREALESGNEKA